MAFMDKVKQQAAVATAMAKEAAAKGQAKIDEAQASVAADQVLKKLGLEIYLERTGRGTASSEDTIAAQVELLKEYEADHGPLSAADSSGGTDNATSESTEDESAS